MRVFYFRDDPDTGDAKCEVVLAQDVHEAWQIIGEGVSADYVTGQIDLLASHPVSSGKLMSYCEGDNSISFPQIRANIDLPDLNR